MKNKVKKTCTFNIFTPNALYICTKKGDRVKDYAGVVHDRKNKKQSISMTGLVKSRLGYYSRIIKIINAAFGSDSQRPTRREFDALLGVMDMINKGERKISPTQLTFFIEELGFSDRKDVIRHINRVIDKGWIEKTKKGYFLKSYFEEIDLSEHMTSFKLDFIFSERERKR